MDSHEYFCTDCCELCLLKCRDRKIALLFRHSRIAVISVIDWCLDYRHAYRLDGFMDQDYKIKNTTKALTKQHYQSSAIRLKFKPYKYNYLSFYTRNTVSKYLFIMRNEG